MYREMMEKSIHVSGTGVVTAEEGKALRLFEFLPDERGVEMVTPCQVNGRLQLLRDSTVCFTAAKKRIRNNSLLMGKVAHGRLSATRDKAFQLTLKVFAAEGIDWQKAFVTEPIEVMTSLMGRERMREILSEQLHRLEDGEYGN